MGWKGKGRGKEGGRFVRRHQLNHQTGARNAQYLNTCTATQVLNASNHSQQMLGSDNFNIFKIKRTKKLHLRLPFT